MARQPKFIFCHQRETVISGAAEFVDMASILFSPESLEGER